MNWLSRSEPAASCLRISLLVLGCLAVGALHAQAAASAQLIQTTTEERPAVVRSMVPDPLLVAAAPKGTDRRLVRLDELAPTGAHLLNGMTSTHYLEFNVRKDHEVLKAQLELVYTASPALLEKLSHIRVYLNEELMGVAQLEARSPGQKQRSLIDLDTRMITSFNRLRLEFVGHYTEICEDLAHSSLWMDLSRDTRLILDQQRLPLASELSYFPEPFLDPGDPEVQRISFVFSQAPESGVLQAAGVLASYFGSSAAWRKVRFEAIYDRLPDGNAIVFMSNGQRPGFLEGLPEAVGPAVQIIDRPDDPTYKLLLVTGRDAADLLVAAHGLALDSPLLRGTRAEFVEPVALAPRRPYDAPRWLPTERAVRFSELVEYPGQLEVAGLRPRPIILNLNLPPDLFVWRNVGIPMRLSYRYTPPSIRDDSRLNLSLNQQFIESYPLPPTEGQGTRLLTRLPVLDSDATLTQEQVLVPAFKMGASNQLRFDFSFASMIGGAQKDQCQTTMPVDVRASIDETSEIDFSGYLHYLEMPNLGAFAGSGFPFSRMADLSETVFVVPETPREEETAVVLQTLGHIGAQSGLPAFRVRMTSEWEEAVSLDADLLWLGGLPESMRERPAEQLLMQGSRATIELLRRGFASRQEPGGAMAAPLEVTDRVGIRSTAPVAAIMEQQSQFFPQRSWMGLMASSPQAFELIIDALIDPGKRVAMKGGITILRESGVHGVEATQRYYVGHLQWWQLLWFRLSGRPVLLAIIAVAAVLLLATLLWMLLRGVARRRLRRDP